MTAGRTLAVSAEFQRRLTWDNPEGGSFAKVLIPQMWARHRRTAPMGAGLENTTLCRGRIIECKRPWEDLQSLGPYRDVQVESLTFFPLPLLSLPWVLLIGRTKQKLEGKGAPGYKAAGQPPRAEPEDICQGKDRVSLPVIQSKFLFYRWTSTGCYLSAQCSFHCCTISLAHGSL